MENNIKETIEKGKENIEQIKKEHDEKQKLKKKRKFVLKIFRSIIAILVLVLLILVMKFVVENFSNDEPTTEVSYTSISQLIDVKDIAKLQVANITYNAIATINKDGEVTQKAYTDKKDIENNVERYISYRGEIIVSYDLEKAKIEKDELNKVYVVYVPEPDLEPNIVGAEFDHIIIDEKSEESYEPGEARSLCLQDLNVKFNIERESLEAVADENMKNAINAYLELFKENDYGIRYEVLRDVE